MCVCVYVWANKPMYNANKTLTQRTPTICNFTQIVSKHTQQAPAPASASTPSRQKKQQQQQQPLQHADALKDTSDDFHSQQHSSQNEGNFRKGSSSNMLVNNSVEFNSRSLTAIYSTHIPANIQFVRV
eukprot:c10506_g2_i1.p1 GENE.c10506_g2_i1~~c10506_g2_i1.p1  ORF type:complete len:128 (+),score=28.65 c10506_g2_i1:110-493(+)